jgi:hypothetical protein
MFEGEKIFVFWIGLIILGLASVGRARGIQAFQISPLHIHLINFWFS